MSVRWARVIWIWLSITMSARWTRIIWILFVLIMMRSVDGTHFRGMLMTYKPAGPEMPHGTMLITYRYAVRGSTDEGTRCDKNTITSRVITGPSGIIECKRGCRGTISNVKFQCTDFSQREDWTQGIKTFQKFFKGPTAEISHRGRNWIALVKGGGEYEIRLFMGIYIRADTGRINSSPTTAVLPIVRLQNGCNHKLSIPVDDVDGDDIRCRWAEFERFECAGVCNSANAIAQLDYMDCSLRISGRLETGFYAAAIMIEDFDDVSSTTPLSSVPVQFLLLVFNSDAGCSSAPTFSTTTRNEGACVGVTQSFVEPITVNTGNARGIITDIDTVSPQGLEKSEVLQRGPVYHLAKGVLHFW
ncbi:unnamed protein product [Owenia fusiformis]|uniref:Uncharacterized protein n=1 Tax=Owenia fusiformis TaxID=6347 RepID=A0A8J1UXU1_OWEFU|nr:unnamed protein product [Owenia fusiformis]